MILPKRRKIVLFEIYIYIFSKTPVLNSVKSWKSDRIICARCTLSHRTNPSVDHKVCTLHILQHILKLEFEDLTSSSCNRDKLQASRVHNLHRQRLRNLTCNESSKVHWSFTGRTEVLSVHASVSLMRQRREDTRWKLFEMKHCGL